MSLIAGVRSFGLGGGGLIGSLDHRCISGVIYCVLSSAGAWPGHPRHQGIRLRLTSRLRWGPTQLPSPDGESGRCDQGSRGQRGDPAPAPARRRAAAARREPGRGDRPEPQAAPVHPRRAKVLLNGPAFDQLLARLVEGGAEFVLVGGLAVNAWGVVRGTKDVDILVDPDPENLRRVAEVAVAAGGRVQKGEALLGSVFSIAAEMATGEQVPIETDLGRLDVVQGLDGVPPYAELRARAEEVEVLGVSLAVCSLEDLRVMKRANGRDRGRRRVPAAGDPAASAGTRGLRGYRGGQRRGGDRAAARPHLGRIRLVRSWRIRRPVWCRWR